MLASQFNIRCIKSTGVHLPVKIACSNLVSHLAVFLNLDDEVVKIITSRAPRDTDILALLSATSRDNIWGPVNEDFSVGEDVETEVSLITTSSWFSRSISAEISRNVSPSSSSPLMLVWLSS